jgi:lipoyl(octanoyl) transferase
VHSPGQKIVYFVLNLNKRKKNIRKLINDIENCIINILRKYKIRSFADSKNIGIWVGKKNNAKKIAAIGIRVSKWVAYHGFSLNISNSLIKYNDIVPCGIKNKGVTSLKELKIRNYKDINNIIIKEFLNIFL